MRPGSALQRGSRSCRCLQECPAPALRARPSPGRNGGCSPSKCAVLQRDLRRGNEGNSVSCSQDITGVTMNSLAVSSTARNGEKHRKSFSLLFYRAVRDLKPVWMLEDMRTMKAFYLEEDAGQRIYSPSEALLYAIVHDHQAYAQYLLSRYALEALAKPGERFCPCASSAPHLAMAVRYDRRYILGLILQETHRIPSTPSYTDPAGCFHIEDGRTPLHLACELLRPEAVILLLGNGASPSAQDHNGLTPLDVLLEKLRDSKVVNGGDKRRCLDNLLLFMPTVRFKMKDALHREPERWGRVLGSETYHYLSGRSPAPLVLSAMQTVLKQLSPATFPDSLLELPIPSCLKPPGLPVSQRDRQGGAQHQ